MGYSRICATFLAIVGVALVLGTYYLGWIIVPVVLQDQIRKEVRLVEGSETWNKWADIKVPIRLKFYVFHVTNPDDIEEGGYPIFEEKGPYVYDEKRKKEEIRVDGDIITYKQPVTYNFNKKESIGSENDLVNIVNLPYISVLNALRSNVGIANILNKNYLRKGGEKAIRTDVRVGDLTFQGFTVKPYKVLGPLLPPEFDNLRFGLYKGKSGLDDGEYRILSGVEDNDRFGEIVTWNRKRKLGYWKGTDSPYCDMINGTDASVFAPFVDKSRILRVFVSDICRSLYMVYKEEIEFMGIKGYRFSTPKDVFEDSRIQEDNACFCLESNRTKCTYAGVLDISVCRGGAPVFMSSPYFLDGDERYRKNLKMKVNGKIIPMVPDPEKHGTNLDLEPNSGLLLNAKKRLQVNLHMEPMNVDGLRNVSDIVFPVVWVEEAAGLDEENAQEVRNKLVTPVKILNTVLWTLICVGISITILGAYKAVKPHKANKLVTTPTS